MDTEEYASVIRAMIQHEDQIRNNRMGWMWALEGLLLTAVALMWTEAVLACLLLCLIGVVSCVSIGYQLTLGQRAIDNLLTIFKKRLGEHYDGAPPLGIWGIKPNFPFLYPWKFMPCALGALWTALLIIKLVELNLCIVVC